MAMSGRNRRQFLAEVGQGMMVATVGYGAARELGLSPAIADEAPARINFGPRESLVALMQETPADKLMPALVGKLREGVALKELVAAGALANARTFGGEDYVGFHAFMALAPAWSMAQQLPESEAALPVLKVLYRNSNRIQEKGGSAQEVLHPIAAEAKPDAAAGNASATAEQIRQAVHAKDVKRAEQLLASAAQRSPEEAYNSLLPSVEEAVEVHRTVLAYRAWDLLELVGREHAVTMLRQSLHYCVDNCDRYGNRFDGLPVLLAKLLDQYRLLEKSPGSRVADDAWIESTSNSLFAATPDQAADLIAAALADGMSSDSVADAVALAANQLVLRDPGRAGRQVQPNKPAGSVHGDSIGVHASDSVNAWRSIARVSDRRNSVTSLILSGWQIANDRGFSNEAMLAATPRPSGEAIEKIRDRDPESLVRELDDAIRHNDQDRACAAVHLYGQQDLAPEPIRARLLQAAIQQDGALHAEKYFRTATEEFDRSRPGVRWRQLVSLARVSASGAGFAPPGMDEAARLLKS
jgi:hypothetical protein